MMLSLRKCNVPENGGIVIASNHPLGGLDALSMMYMISKKRKDMRFIVNDILLSWLNILISLPILAFVSSSTFIVCRCLSIFFLSFIYPAIKLFI